jgi:CheY-like chemotaxis protein
MPAVPEPDAAAPGNDPPTAVALPRLRILVAEDNAINQRVIDSLLRRQGWTALLAGNGRLACEAWEREAFDLILMDIQMPEMDGLEAARWIRQRERDRQCANPIPVVALTAHASQAQHDQCMAAGMDGVVTKPVSLSALVKCIGEVFAKRHANV